MLKFWGENDEPNLFNCIHMIFSNDVKNNLYIFLPDYKNIIPNIVRNLSAKEHIRNVVLHEFS